MEIITLKQIESFGRAASPEGPICLQHLTVSLLSQSCDISQPTMATQTITQDASLESQVSVTAAKLSTYQGYDNVHWYVGNAKQVASYYTTRMGFERIAYRGLETGSKVVASHVVRNGKVTFVLTSPLHSKDTRVDDISQEDRSFLGEIHRHLEFHGDAVRDVAFTVDNVEAVYSKAVQNGAKTLYAPRTVSDQYGICKYARICTYGDTTHTLIERGGYRGAFLPGFVAVGEKEPLNVHLPPVKLAQIDHCVGNQDWKEMDAVCD